MQVVRPDDEEGSHLATLIICTLRDGRDAATSDPQRQGDDDAETMHVVEDTVLSPAAWMKAVARLESLP